MYLKSINKNNYVLSEINNPEIALVALFDDVNIKVFKVDGVEKQFWKRKKQFCYWLLIIYKLKKNYIIKWNLIINFCDKAKFIKTNVFHYDNSKNYAFKKILKLLNEKEYNDFTKKQNYNLIIKINRINNDCIKKMLKSH